MGDVIFFLTLLDDKSRCTWIYLLIDKSTILSLFLDFFTLIKDQFHTSVKFLRTDNGTEFMNRSLTASLATLVIIH